MNRPEEQAEQNGKAKSVASWLLERIKKGAFEKGCRLPGDLELMKRFGVSRGTVRAAVAVLQHQGLVVRRPGVGTFLSRRGERKSGLVGLLFPELESCEYYKDVGSELLACGRRLGYEVVVMGSVGDGVRDMAAEMRSAARTLAEQPLEGVVFCPLINEKYGTINQEVAGIFANAKMPLVLFDSDVEMKPKRSSFDVVAVNNVDAGRSVAELLIKGGRKRIAFNMVDCVEGMSSNIRNRFFGLAGESVVLGAYDSVRAVTVKPSDATALGKLLRGRWRPDAFVCGNDEIAAQLVEALKGLGVRVPEDVAVVGFDDVASARLCVPPLTTVRQPSRQIAQALLKTLLFRMRNPDAPPQEINLPAPLICRKTT